MHPNPAYRGAGDARNLAFARERGFGMLTMAATGSGAGAGTGGPLASHIPFVMSADGGTLAAHVVRSNPIWRALRAGPAPALVAVTGPDGYVSPDWYGVEDQVPTWNYVAVHLRGEVRLAPEDGLRAHLDDLSAAFETRLAPKPVWRAEKMDAQALARMMRMIAPVAMTVESVDGTWKLSQNKPDDVRLRASEAVGGSPIGGELAALAALMKAPPA